MRRVEKKKQSIEKKKKHNKPTTLTVGQEVTKKEQESEAERGFQV